MLKWNGVICPCLEKSEDRGAREALALLSGLSVSWLKTGRDKGIGGMVSGWFSAATKGEQVSADIVKARLQWIDKEDGPELQIKPTAQTSLQENGEISLKKQSSGYIKTVPLKQLDKVELQDGNLVVLQTEAENGRMKDLVSLQVDDGKGTVIKEAFTQMVEWDGRRRSAIPEEDRELDERQGIKARAQKAAHFAKREIELQQHRRERDKRKARYAESGGLKYTALAMANRAAAEDEG